MVPTDEDGIQDETPQESDIQSTLLPEEDVDILQDEEIDRDHLQLVEDIQKVTAAYAKTTGVDQADMEGPDRATSLHDALPPFPPSRRQANLELVRDMFTHAYDSYMYNAYPASEVKPLTCRPGTFDLVKLPALTLIDTLDTLIIMENYTEFARGVERLRDLHKSMQEVEYQGKTTHILRGGIFSTNANVSLFETNIRVMGGLLSAHQLAVAFLQGKVPKQDVRDTKGAVLIGPIVLDSKSSETTPAVERRDDEICSLKDVEEEMCKLNSNLQDCIIRDGKRDSSATKNTTASNLASATYWTYDGFLLELAHDLGKRMVPAFQTKTGIPYGTVNLVDGIPQGESKVASLAGAGTLSLEFELLSRLTGDESFGQEAKLASRALWMRRSKKDLLGKHINIERGGWTETLSGIGSNSDSFYEYLVKHYILFPEDADFWPMFLTSYYGVYNESRIGEWYADVDMNNGNSGASRRVFESLMAFYPGMQVLIGELGPAAKTLNGFFMVREALGLLPERFNYGGWKVDGAGAGLHPLRPELLESCYFLHKSTQGMPLKRSNADDVHGTSGWLWAADYALHSIHWHTWAPCGYSAVSGVSPQTTGGIPGSQAKNKRPQAVNEMPSFFLSETLKYLYLTFDEDNLLHRDLDRQWVFTTEAHPIHNEPAVQKSSGTTEAVKHRQRILDMLKKRAAGSLPPKSPQRPTRTEKWTEKSAEADFMRQLSETLVNNIQAQPSIARKGCELFDMDIFQPSFLPIVSDGDEFSTSQQDDSNIAHLSLAPSGAGMQPLAKACVNLYSPSLAWVHALNGGAVDYSSVYISSVHDEIPIDTRYGVGLLSASRALALMGTGLFLGKDPTEKDNTCPVSVLPPGKQRASDSTAQRFDMGGTLGEFEVAVYPDGSGFSIKRMASGETIVATVVHAEHGIVEDDEEENTMPYIMLYSSTAPPPAGKLLSSPNLSQSWLPDMNWKSVLTRAGSSTSEESAIAAQESKTARSVVVGDASGASFSCELHIVRRTRSDEDNLSFGEGSHGDFHEETEETIKSFPCAPGLFGPTRVPNLALSGGLFVEGALKLPDPGNIDGCIEIDRAEETHAEQTIRMVHRGSCTFQSKAQNQKQLGANAVIVVNSIQNPHELFLMARGMEPDDHSDDFVAAILISGIDGLEISRSVDENSSETLFAKIEIAPQTIVIDDIGNVQAADGSADVRFPILQASSEAIQVFSADGWGVHAVARPVDEATTSGAGQTNQEWQLFLLQHSNVPQR